MLCNNPSFEDQDHKEARDGIHVSVYACIYICVVCLYLYVLIVPEMHIRRFWEREAEGDSIHVCIYVCMHVCVSVHVCIDST